MIITPVLDHGLEQVFMQNRPGYVRSAGVHMSDLYGALYETIEPKRYDKDRPLNPLMCGAGFTFEEIFEAAVKDRLTPGSGRPDEFVHHEPGIATPIIFSPDLILFNGHTRDCEIKLTWMSTKEVPREPSNNFPTKFAKYVTQMACYCYCLETPYARLVAFHVCGNYYVNGKGRMQTGGVPAPELLCWDIEFSRRELLDEWNAVINHAKHARLL